MRCNSSFFKIFGKNFLSTFWLLFSLFTWRQISLIILRNFSDHMQGYEMSFLSYAVYYLASASLTIISSYFKEKFNHKNYYLWIIVAIVSYISLLFCSNLLPFAFLSGVSVGMGIPLCLAYFADNTYIENRGKSGALTFFITSLSFPLLVWIQENYLFFGLIWIIIALLVIFLLKPKVAIEEVERKISFRTILTNRQFILFFLSWSIFCFIDAFEAPILDNFLEKSFSSSTINFLANIGTVVTAFAILLSGIVADYYGRKIVLTYGFVTLGLAYAIIGVAYQNILSWLIFSVIDGAATGLFIVIFVFTIWGDLSQKGLREKYYAIGSLPFFLIFFIQKLLFPYVVKIPVSAAFSFASFFLFLAVIPLLYAPETLPEKIIRRRELRKYVEKAKKIREKYEKEKD